MLNKIKHHLYIQLLALLSIIYFQFLQNFRILLINICLKHLQLLLKCIKGILKQNYLRIFILKYFILISSYQLVD